MSKRILTFFALALCAGLFLFPTSAFAADSADTTPPTLSAKLTGETLHIETADNVGVEAIFIDGLRVNYRVDGAIDVRLRDYAGTEKTVKIYAVDFAGNKSKTAEISNPHYTAPVQTPAPAQTPAPTQTPAPATPAPSAPAVQPSAPVSTPAPVEPTEPTESAIPREPNPFTPAGTGTVADNATDGDGKEFFTVVTADENVFYLIIDRQRDSENVYLLNTVTEDDLMALAEKSSGTSQSAVPTPVPEPTPTPTPEPTPDPEPPVTEKENNTGTILLILLVVLGAGGAGYYFKIVKPKQNAIPDDEDEYDDDSDYADEPEDYEDDYGFEDSEETQQDEE